MFSIQFEGAPATLNLLGVSARDGQGTSALLFGDEKFVAEHMQY